MQAWRRRTPCRSPTSGGDVGSADGILRRALIGRCAAGKRLAIMRRCGSNSRMPAGLASDGDPQYQGPDMSDTDPFELERFVTAQAPVFAIALNELKAGCKRSHWMWFIFPQLRGLGSSPMATFYGISSLEEARAYLAHVLLGPRLILCTEAALAVRDQSATAIFGSPDDMKFRSSMTLFAFASGDDASPFRQALGYFWGGRMDETTLVLLGQGAA
jgi:uncharacterized protein (DUF1810 family)